MGGSHAGARIGPFVVEDKLGQGAMGTVYRARHLNGTLAAVKLVSRQTESSAKRFERETQALRALDHPYVVRYLGAGAGPPTWLAMELVEGRDLEDVLAAGPLPFDEAARVVGQIAEGIAHAHKRNVLHRDLKPANVLIRDADGVAVVTDFGLAKDLDASRFTQTGTLLGTVAYMSPEQLSGRSPVRTATDVWALGAILFRCLCDREPFLSQSHIATVSVIMEGNYPRPRSLVPSLPRELESVIAACLQVQPEHRPTAQQIAERLRNYTPEPEETPRRAGPLIAGAALAVLAGGLGLFAATRSPGDASPSPEVDPPLEEQTKAPPPWGEPTAPWTRVWSLADDATAEASEPALWPEPGRTAAPLAAAATPAGLRAAFLGSAERRGERVRVSYVDLTRAGRVELLNPVGFFRVGDGTGSLTASTNGAQILSRNDSTNVRVWVGRARWAQARVRLAIRRVAPEDGENFDVALGEGRHPQRAVLGLYNRGGVLGAARAETRAQLTEAWTEVEFAPGLESPRVRFGDADVAPLEEALHTLPAPSGVELMVNELNAEVDALSVEGVPLRTDVPALARSPLAATGSVRVAAEFVQDDAGFGGPFVALHGTTTRLTLELDRRTLILTLGDEVLLTEELPIRPPAGWLLLERSGATLRCVVSGSERVERTLVWPFASDDTLRAAYGSTAPEVRFKAVELLDAPAPSAPPESETWRRGAILLAGASDPRRADPDLVGPAGADARRARCEEALRVLRSAADGLSGPARDDARARAVLAAVLAGDGGAGIDQAKALVGGLGRERAVELIDRLQRNRGQPDLAERLSRGFGAVYDPPLREAGLLVASELLPERNAEILLQLADCVRHRDPAPDPRTPEGRETLEGALRLFSRARDHGAPEDRVNGSEAGTLMTLGRFQEAADLYTRNQALGKASWWHLFRLSQARTQLGHHRLAVEACLASLAEAPRRQQVWAQLQQTLRNLAKGGAHPGLISAGTLALGIVSGRQAIVDAAVRTAKQRPMGDARDAHLQAYVFAAVRIDTPLPDGDESPTAVLARARAGEPAALQALAAAAREAPLVASLARIDPALSKHLR